MPQIQKKKSYILGKWQIVASMFWNSYTGVFQPDAVPMILEPHEVHVLLVRDSVSLARSANNEADKLYVSTQKHSFRSILIQINYATKIELLLFFCL